MRREARTPLDPDKNKHENTSGGLPAHSCLKALAVRQEILAPSCSKPFGRQCCACCPPTTYLRSIALDTRVLGVEDPGTKLMIRAENHLNQRLSCLSISAAALASLRSACILLVRRGKPRAYARHPFATEVCSLEMQFIEISPETIKPARGNDTHSHQRRSRMRPAHPLLCRTNAFAFVVSFRMPTLALPCLHNDFLLLRHLTRQNTKFTPAQLTRVLPSLAPAVPLTHTLFCHPDLRRAPPNFLPPSVPNALGTLLTAHVCTISARVTEFPVATALRR